MSVRHDCGGHEILVTLWTRGRGTPALKCMVCQRDRPVPEPAPEPEAGDLVGFWEGSRWVVWQLMAWDRP